MGAETKLKQKVGRRPPPCAPRRVPARQGYPATTPPAPPSGHRNATPTPPRKRRSPRRNPLSTIKARAASHPIAGVPGAVAPGEIYFESPPSPEGKGVGGMGAEKQAKVKGQAGNQKGKPPVGYHSGKVGRRLPPLHPPCPPHKPTRFTKYHNKQTKQIIQKSQNMSYPTPVRHPATNPQKPVFHRVWKRVWKSRPHANTACPDCLFLSFKQVWKNTVEK